MKAIKRVVEGLLFANRREPVLAAAIAGLPENKRVRKLTPKQRRKQRKSRAATAIEKVRLFHLARANAPALRRAANVAARRERQMKIDQRKEKPVKPEFV